MAHLPWTSTGVVLLVKAARHGIVRLPLWQRKP
jgi:hypothetical protein